MSFQITLINIYGGIQMNILFSLGSFISKYLKVMWGFLRKNKLKYVYCISSTRRELYYA